MKRTLLLAAALGALAMPAFAQQSPSGTSAGGPARVGNPGEIGGGVPGTRPGVVGAQAEPMRAAPVRKAKRKRSKKR
jgi:hypothetical protein